MKKGNSRKDVLLRLRKIESQLRGLQKMVDEEVPCLEILPQVTAATAATKKVGRSIIQDYMKECLIKAQEESRIGTDETMRDFHKAISRYMDWA